ncbi:MAG: ribonuclease H-like domain-containing protein [Candidatus Yonathbacteria bacterium]|nr:ribonuclease H-like domain-containing protein [Candidatus Yonathbacteria bacterium]
MSTLIFDIETVGEDFETFDQATHDSLTRWVKREPLAEQERLVGEIKNNLGLSPLTGRIVAIGVLDDEKGKGAVYFDAPNARAIDREENGMKLKPMNEKEMLEHFWRGVAEYETFISFNGRGFDVPFLMVRSAVHGIRPTKDLMSNRYLGNQDYDSRHIDLMDQLSFYGAVRRRGSLHMWCRAFGITSPKSAGITGADIKRLYDERRFEDIARYNAGDLAATRALYHHWKKNIAF